MSTASVWFVAIDKAGRKRRPTTVPPTTTSGPLPRVTTIHVVNWHSEDHKVDVLLDPDESIDILIDVPKI
jgi:hypothetical protein